MIERRGVLRSSLVFVVLLSILLSVNLVLAQGFDIRQGSEALINFFADWGEPIFDALLGGDDYYGELLFEKVLVFFVLLGMVYISLSRIEMFSSNKKILWIISFIVPILSVRLINFAWLRTVLLSYQVLGIALLGFLPFVIYLVFVHQALEQYPIARKISWIFFIVVYFALWASTDVGAYAGIYFWTMLIAFLFLLFDGTIHYYLLMQKWMRYDESSLAARLGELNREIDAIQNSGLPDSTQDRLIRRLEKKKKRLIKLMH